MLAAIRDSSTLIALTAIGRLDLLRQFYGAVTIPTAVWREVVEQGQGRAGALAVAQACQDGWIEIKPITSSPLTQLLKRDLGEGEAEVIALAIEQAAQIVLLDESEGRRVADSYGLRKTGVVGLLLRAKQEGQISALKTELDKLRAEAGFHLEERLYHRALAAVGESAD